MKKVVSMSRRTEMFWHSGKLIKILNEKYPPEKVHTVICWTKFPEAVYTSPYRDALKNYDQVYVQLTVTGLGSTPIEPGTPPWGKVMEQIPSLIEFLGSPDRICLRPDPLLAVKDSASRVITNIEVVKKIIARAGEMGIKTFSTSFMEVYPKVEKRLQKYGYTPVNLPHNKREQVIDKYLEIASTFSGNIYTCCVPGFTSSSCINGSLIQELHPLGESCSTKIAKGQRKMCGCTESVDIGWYSMSCKSECLYCYANPAK